MSTIEVENIGPITKLEIQVPADGGVCVLRGRNGSGKSTALEAAEALTGKAAKLTTRDGSNGSGIVRGVGATVLLGRKITRAGEVEVASLEGRISIADLVQPPIKDPAAADRQRIKALVSLTGVEPSVSMFREVVGDAVDDIEVDWTGDVVEVSGRVKRALESKARSLETEASVREGQAKNAEDAAKDIGEDEPHDEGQLRAANIEAASAYRSMVDWERNARAAADHIAEARRKLEAARAGYTGPTVTSATDARLLAGRRCTLSNGRLAQIRKELAEAEEEDRAARAAFSSACHAVEAAQEHAQTVASYEQALQAASPELVDPARLQAAQEAAEAAAAAVERGAVIRQALEQRAKAKGYRDTATKFTLGAEKLRTAAGQIDDALSRQITTERLYVQDGRLYARGHPRGDVAFADLSEGERWSLAFDAVAPIVGEHGLIVLPQGAWEGLDRPNRQHVSELARRHKLVVLTAEATDGDIVAEEFAA